ncbi:MAG: NADPH-dependent glutamate synthase [Endomicrobium sp.]|jgi:glutamate synthase (NADPH/NADH) small chain|nr:NADPH-dependent glutamate synthase [Endomicrobium sp.]
MSQNIRMLEREPKIRKHDFEQISFGYSKEEMLIEARRCLQCKKPMCCVGCPVEVDIPKFIKFLSDDKPQEAIKILRENNSLPAVCGRVCPQETQCEKFCILYKQNASICIGNLERYAADSTSKIHNSFFNISSIKKNGLKIAVVGSGPAGLTCGGDLLRMGYDVTIYESLHDSGGVLRYGIPEFRLPKKILDIEINILKKSGMKINLNTFIGRTKTIRDLFNEGYKSIFIAVGAGLPIFPNIPGENLNHVYSASEFLVRINLMHAYDFPIYDTPVYKGKNVVVIGGGNTAMDSARTSIRLGAKTVKLIYRRTEDEMPSRKEEKKHAKEEGVEFIVLTSPVRFIGDVKRFVKAVECVKMESNGHSNFGVKNSLKKIDGSNHIIETDMVILALGLHPNPVLSSLTNNLNIDTRGYLIVDNNYMTSIPGIFAGGDIVGGSTVIEAIGMGKKAAKAIVEYIKKTNRYMQKTKF